MEAYKTFEAITLSAFEAGVQHGAGYPSIDAIPPGATDDAYAAWRGRWAGQPHEGPTGATEDRARTPAREDDWPSTYGKNAEYER